jgi:ubiquinone/menaquinone biosynthesis C-methylase UbiE
MTAIKKNLKRILEKTAGVFFFKQIHFKLERGKNYFSNQQYRKRNPHVVIPPDVWLFETFQLSYQKYFEDGDLASLEILKWTKDLLPSELPTILDWGCGTGRIVQHLHRHHPYLLLYGADINKEMIAWNHQNIKDVYFSHISLNAPTAYPNNYFDMIYGISVFTHIPSIKQKEWVEEMYRIIKPSGILLVTTMGSIFRKKLFADEILQLENEGVYEKPFQEKNMLLPGDRNYSVYETALFFENMITPYFLTLHFYDGSIYPKKFGGQDVWILQKK